MAQTLADLKEDFALLSAWEDRYRYLIELGEALPKLPESAKIPEHKVKGCMSQVWLVGHVNNGIYTFEAESDAVIVQGLIALVRLLFNNRPVAEVATLNPSETLQELGLSQHLSPNRRNGLIAMIQRIQNQARAAAA